MPEAVTRTPRIIYCDLETTDLDAMIFGRVLMMGYQEEGLMDEPRVVCMNEFPGWDERPLERQDYQMVKWIGEYLMGADILMGHFIGKPNSSKGFDFPFIQTRLMVHGLPLLPPIPTLDTWRVAKNNLRTSSYRLKNLLEGLELNHRKSVVEKKYWARSKAHDPQAIAEIAKYCAQDVRAGKALADLIRPLAVGLPNMQLLKGSEVLGCPRCGGERLQRRGTRITGTLQYHRYHCQDCGHWPQGRKTITPPSLERLR